MKQLFLLLIAPIIFGYSGFSQDTISSDTLILLQEKEPNSYQAKDTVIQVEDFDEGYWIVEHNAIFQGGDINKFSYWVSNNLVYPQQAAEKNITGKLIVQFAVNRKGDVCDVKILRGLHPAIDQAAIDCIRKSPKWKPATQGGINVKQNFSIPINFTLNIEQDPKKE
jgi:periplasmic protein TonB